MEQQSSAIEIFCCYAHEDENLLNEVGLGVRLFAYRGVALRAVLE